MSRLAALPLVVTQYLFVHQMAMSIIHKFPKLDSWLILSIVLKSQNPYALKYQSQKQTAMAFA